MKATHLHMQCSLVGMSRHVTLRHAVVASGVPEDAPQEPWADAKLQDIHLDEAEGDEGASGAEEEEEEAAEPAAKHGWNEDEPQRDAMPEAGPQGLASQSAAAQVRLHTEHVLLCTGGMLQIMAMCRPCA